MPKRILPLIPAGLAVVQVAPTPDRVTITTAPTSSRAACPACGGETGRVHSRYPRRLADLPWQGRPMELVVVARRFRCPRRSCPRRVFAERLPAAPAWARRTGRVGGVQRQLGLALGGMAGSRLADRLAMPASGSTLLRLVRATQPPARGTPRALGVDDFALRRGQRYGTMLLDLETHDVVDLLPDREGATLAAWLRRHPGVEVVSRDRASAYAEGARSGAPGAVQVADRWHLLRNCTDAFQLVLDRNRGLLREAAKAVAARAAADEPRPEPRRRPPTRAELRQRERRADRERRHADVAAMARSGMGLRAIRRETGLSRNTIRRWLAEGRPRDWGKGRRPSIVDPYLAHIHDRLAGGCRNATQLWREIRERGYPGKVILVRAVVARIKEGDPAYAVSAAQPVWRRPSVRQLTRMLAGELRLSGLDAAYAGEVRAGGGEIPAAADLARRFAAMMRGRDAAAFPGWLAEARGGPLGGFAESLRRDTAAVEAALSLPWSNGPVEGKITKLKLVKRSMYGRANLDLLRHRLMAA